MISSQCDGNDLAKPTGKAHREREFGAFGPVPQDHVDVGAVDDGAEGWEQQV